MTRKPVAAGKFYPRREEELRQLLGKLFSQAKGINPVNAKSAIAPHAGYVYSGKTAAKTYKAVKEQQPKTIVIIGPDHYGASTGMNSPGSNEWKTPLGTIKIDQELRDKLTEKGVRPSKKAHRYEHSLEVQVPFLQYVFDHEFKILPITMSQQNLENAQKLAKAIPEEALVIASSDFTHYQPLEQAEKTDKEQIKNIVSLKTEKFLEDVKDQNISICGYGPIATAIEIAKNRDAEKGKLLEYTTSAEATGDEQKVVGYASIIFQ